MMLYSQIDYIVFVTIFVIIVTTFTIFFKRLYNKSSFLSERSSFLRVVLGVTIVLVVIIFFFGYNITYMLGNLAEDTLRREAKLTLSFLETAIEGEIDKVDAGVLAMSGSPWIYPAFENPTPKTLANANFVLDRYHQSFKVGATYILDTTGTTIASSNRNTAHSFIGKDYSFRPYFKQALSGSKASYFAMGVTSGTRGYYSSAPVKNSIGQTIGVVVIKNELDKIDSIFSSVPFAFLTDDHDVIFVASDKNDRFKTIYPLSDSLKKTLIASRQFGQSALDPIVKKGRLLEGLQVNGKQYIETKIPFQIPNWSITLFSSKASILRYRLLGIAGTIALILAILITISLIALHRVKDWLDSIFISEQRFRTIFENAPEGIVICEADSGKIASVNPLAREWMSSSGDVESLLFQNFLKKEFDTDPSNTCSFTPESFQGLYFLKNNLRVRNLSVSSTQIQFKGKACILSFLRDISAIIKAQNALEASEQKYRELAEFLPEAVFETDLNGNLTFLNKRGFSIFNYDQSDFNQGLSIEQLVIPEEHTQLLADMKNVLDGKAPLFNEYTGVGLNRSCFPILIHHTSIIREGRPVGLCGITIDLTEQKKVELELQRKDKLEALGILAGGIAHDFNNLLTSIWAGLSLIKMNSDKESENSAIVTDLEVAVKRGKDLTTQLLTYSRGGAPIKKITSILEIIKATSSFTTTGTPVRCNILAQNDLLPVEIDDGQISQVIQNLLINAIQAIPGSGTIEIEIRNVITLPERVPLQNGTYIEVIVSDTGAGIPKDILPRIFDPFFTTKPKGSGLGLATAYAVVKRHNGHIYVDSIEGKGTSFHIFLPSVNKPLELVQPDELIVKGRGRILIMDDEAIIRILAEKLLKHIGYVVVTTTNGEETIRLYKEAMDDGHKFDVVILDLTIPAGMGGKDTMKNLLELDKEVKALVSSGYSNDPIMAEFKQYGFKGVISKPYNIGELSKLIKSIS